MQAIILNSGTGSRMGVYTKNNPKCLVEIEEGKTILSRQLELLSGAGITDFLITTGPFANQIESEVAKKFPNLNVNYVHNDKYDSTNYIYSLLLAKEHIKGDRILLLHGDLVFDSEIVDIMINADADLVLVNKSVEAPKEDFKGRLEAGYVREIGVNLDCDNCHFLLAFYNISRELMNRWLEEMEVFQARKELTVYAENALNEILAEDILKPAFFTDELCSEIDDVDDLARVRDEIITGRD